MCSDRFVFQPYAKRTHQFILNSTNYNVTKATIYLLDISTSDHLLLVNHDTSI